MWCECLAEKQCCGAGAADFITALEPNRFFGRSEPKAAAAIFFKDRISAITPLSPLPSNIESFRSKICKKKKTGKTNKLTEYGEVQTEDLVQLYKIATDEFFR